MGATAVISPPKLLRPVHPLVWVMISMLAVWGAGVFLTDQNSASFSNSGTGPPGVSERIVVRDLANGAVGIFHAESGASIVRYESGQGAFVRTIFRSLVRDRRVQGVSAEPVWEPTSKALRATETTGTDWSQQLQRCAQPAP